jgi:hypothetical protein
MLSKLGFGYPHSLLSKGLDMIPLDITNEQIHALRYERFHHPHPRVQKKMEVIFSSLDELPYIIGLVRQALESQLGSGNDL